MVSPRPRRAEPHRRIAARHDVGFHAERRHKEIVDHVFAGHHQANVPVHRNVQLVDFAPAVGLLQLPHPLLGDDVDFQRFFRRAAHVDVDAGAPAEHHHREQERNSHPRRFESHRARDRDADFIGFLAAELQEEIENGDGDHRGEKHGHQEQVEKQRVHAARETRGALRKQWKFRLHGLSWPPAISNDARATPGAGK